MSEQPIDPGPPPEGYGGPDRPNQQWVIDTFAYQRSLIDDLLGRVDMLAATDLVDGESIANHETRIAALEGEPPVDPPPPPRVPNPWLTHVYEQTPEAVARDIDTMGVNGVFLYRTETRPDGKPDPQRVQRHVDYARTRGETWWMQVGATDYTDSSIRDALAYGTDEERARKIACRGQEMQHKISVDEYPAHLDRQTQLWDVAEEFGCLKGVHLEAWSLNPGNKAVGAGRDNFIRLLGDTSRLDVLAVSCMDWNQHDSATDQLTPVEDIWLEHCPDARLMVTSMCWTVPAGDPLGSQKRGMRRNAVQSALAYTSDPTVYSGFGWFWGSAQAAWEGKDCGVVGDPDLLPVIQAATAAA